MHHDASTDRHTGRCDGEADAGGCSDTTGPADPQSEISRDGPPSVSVQDALGVDDEHFAGGRKDRREVCDGESLSKDEAQRRSTVPQQPLAAVPCVFGPRAAIATAVVITVARLAQLWWRRRGGACHKGSGETPEHPVHDGGADKVDVIVQVAVSEAPTTSTATTTDTTVDDLRRELRILKGDSRELRVFSFKQLMALSEKQAAYTKNVQDELIKRARQMSPSSTPTLMSPRPSPSSRPVSSTGSTGGYSSSSGKNGARFIDVAPAAATDAGK